MDSELVAHWQTVPLYFLPDSAFDSAKAINISTLLKAFLFLHIYIIFRKEYIIYLFSVRGWNLSRFEIIRKLVLGSIGSMKCRIDKIQSLKASIQSGANLGLTLSTHGIISLSSNSSSYASSRRF